MESFLDSHRMVELVCFNGQKASVMYDEHFIRRETVRYVTFQLIKLDRKGLKKALTD